MKLKIETASIHLLEKFCEIENQCFDREAFTKRQLAYLLTDYNSIALAAKADCDIAGFIISQIEIENDESYGHIVTLNVAPSYRRKGVGSQMLDEIEKILKEKGANECHLEVREDNIAALKLYLKCGYQKIAKLEKYYGNKNGLFLKKIL